MLAITQETPFLSFFYYRNHINIIFAQGVVFCPSNGVSTKIGATYRS